MVWLFISSLSYLLTAITSITDKFLISKKIPSPAAYAFYVGLLSISAIIFIPFGFYLPSFYIILIAFASGFAFFFSLYFFFCVLSLNEASRVVTVVGALTPLFSLLLGFLLLGEGLNERNFIAFGILLLGGILISLEKEKFSWKITGFGLLLLAAFSLALSYVLAKLVYLNQPFLSGFIWTRIGSFLAALLFLIPASYRRLIFETSRTAEMKTGIVFVANKALGGIAYILLNFSFTLQNISLINALQGLQYAFLFGLTLVLSHKFPNILKEETQKSVIIQKITAIVLIGIGLGILAL